MASSNFLNPNRWEGRLFLGLVSVGVIGTLVVTGTDSGKLWFLKTKSTLSKVFQKKAASTDDGENYAAEEGSAAGRQGAGNDDDLKGWGGDAGKAGALAEAQGLMKSSGDRENGSRKMNSSELNSGGITSAALLNYGKDAAGRCVAVEMPGRGIASEGWSDVEWVKVQAAFAETQRKILDWFKGEGIKAEGKLDEAIVNVISRQIRGLKIERPSKDEPDLGFRGIVTYALDSGGDSVIRVGGGFSDIIAKNPKRAQFEMARVILHSVNPCELKRLGSAQPWNQILSCLKIPVQESCGAGQYSEAGWAISSVFAQKIADPGCAIRALAAPKAKECIAKFQWTSDAQMASGIQPEIFGTVDSVSSSSSASVDSESAGNTDEGTTEGPSPYFEAAEGPPPSYPMSETGETGGSGGGRAPAYDSNYGTDGDNP
ncbi:MAG: hypothetical protein JNL01_13460 [Bdellovibrionales bacterium]|nr:hypothetical protein [Bdellovibrionales bacterium]